MVLINMGHMTITTGLSGELFYYLLHLGFAAPVAAVCAIPVYFASNLFLAASINCLRYQKSMSSVLKDMLNAPGAIVSTLSMLSIGAVAGLLYKDVGPWSVVLMVALFFFVRRMLQRAQEDAETIQAYAAEIKLRYNSSITSLAHAIDARDPYTFGHSLRVAALTKRISLKLELAYDMDDVYFAGLLHDVGKIALPDRILLKPGLLVKGELSVIMRHPVHGQEILQDSGVTDNIMAAVRWHHEWISGGGYPDGLSGDAIPLIARIVSVADAFDAMVSNRPYRSGCTIAEARERLFNGAGKQFDADLVQTLFAVLDGLTPEELHSLGYGERPPNSEVKPVMELPETRIPLAVRFAASRAMIEAETATAAGSLAAEIPMKLWQSTSEASE